MNEMLIPNARLFADRHQLELAERLGSGKDGIVLAAKPKANPAKVEASAKVQALAKQGGPPTFDSRLKTQHFSAFALRHS